MTTLEWILPRSSIAGSYGCTFDIANHLHPLKVENCDSNSQLVVDEDYNGGTACKVVYIAKETTDLDDGQCRVCCAYFPKSEVDKAIALIKERADLNTEPGPNDGREAVMHTTGVSVRSAIKEAIATSFNVRVENIMETESMIKAFRFMCDTLPRTKVVLPITERAKKLSSEVGPATRKHFIRFLKRECKDNVDPVQMYLNPQISTEPYSEEENIYPLLLCNLGTAGNYNVVHEDGTFRSIGGTNQSGIYLMGMASLLLDIRDYDTLMDLAEKGDSGNVSIMMKDLGIVPKNVPFNSFPGLMEIFAFGKAASSDKSQFRKQDIARALLSVHTSALSQCIYLTSQVNKCKNVYLTGGLFSHPLYRDMFFSAFLLMVYQNCDKDPVQVYFVKDGVYTVALGALLRNAEYYSQQNIEKTRTS